MILKTVSDVFQLSTTAIYFIHELDFLHSIDSKLSDNQFIKFLVDFGTLRSQCYRIVSSSLAFNKCKTVSHVQRVTKLVLIKA
ncbi:Dihydroxyacetone phosphate acyltransferase [Dirofilaria immitis]